MTIDNFVGSLVEMAKAYEELPMVQRQLNDLRSELDKAQDTIASREIKIMQLSQEADLLNSRIRSLEVERDDAQFHALEADDRTQRALDFIKATFGNAGSLIQAFIRKGHALLGLRHVSRAQRLRESVSGCGRFGRSGDNPSPGHVGGHLVQ